MRDGRPPGGQVGPMVVVSRVVQGGLRFAHVAQSAEHFLGKEEVNGSNPFMGSKYLLGH